MSVLDDLQAFEDRVAGRLRELEPLVAEYEELRKVADRLGFKTTDAKPARPPAARATKRAGSGRASAPASGRRRPGGTRATGTERRARVLQLVERRPGITVPEISKAMGVDPPPLYRVVRKLQADGTVIKEGQGLRLAK